MRIEQYIEDRWNKEGPHGKVPSAEHGRGMQYQFLPPKGPRESFTRLSDARHAKTAYLAEALSGKPITPRRRGEITIRDYAETWRTTRLRQGASTEGRTERYLRQHVYPKLGRFLLSDPEIAPAVTAMLKAKEDLADSTRITIYDTLKSMYRTAVNQGHVDRNPLNEVERPKPAPEEILVPSAEEVHRIVDAAPPRYRAPVLLAAGAGLRWGEVFGLEADAVRFMRDRDLHVRQALKRDDTGPWYIGLPKHRKKRTVDLPETVLQALRDHIAAGHGPTSIELTDKTDRRTPVRREANLLFTTNQGGRVTSQGFAKMWHKTLKRAGLPDSDYTLHSMRHYFVTALIGSGAPVKIVQLQAGHSSADFTLRRYTHWWPDQEAGMTRGMMDAALSIRPDDDDHGVDLGGS